MVDKKTQGKKNRKSGAAFELKIRKDLESKGWIVSKWQNNVEFGYFEERIPMKFIPRDWDDLTLKNGEHYPGPIARLIPAKRKFNLFNRALTLGTGFPDFICYTRIGETPDKLLLYNIIGVEAKINGYLDKEEKEKCQWLLDNGIFSKILIAQKGSKRGEIIYNEYEN